MDSITQAVLGAGISGALLGRSMGRRALLYGALLGSLPDLDVLESFPDPVSTMTFHRGYSHSVFVLTAAAAAATALIHRFFPSPKCGAGRLFLMIWLVLVTHPLLDAFTSYGTQLLWPMTPTPTSWSSLFIIDPAYTVPMLVAVLTCAIVGFGKRSWRFLCGSLIYGCMYIAFSLGGKFVAEQRVREVMTTKNIAVTDVFSAPMPLNTLLWRVVVKSGPDTYIEVMTGLLDSRPPETLVQSRNVALAEPLRKDALHARLEWFTGGWLRYDQIGDALVVTDLRMGMPGHYTFRFKMGERREGIWSPVLPQIWPSPRGGMEELKMVFRRIWSAEPALPLQDWARGNTRQPSTSQP